MKVSGGNFAGQYSSYVMDSSEKCVLVAGPSYKGVNVPLGAGASVEISCTVFNGIYEFPGEVVKSVSDPAYGLLVNLPDWEYFDHVQRRRFVRLSWTHSVEYQILDDTVDPGASRPPKQSTTTRDISGNGICLVLKEPLERGVRLDLFLKIFEDRPPIYVMGEVVRSEPVESSGNNTRVFHVGIQFINIRLSDQDRIVRFIFDQQRQMAR